MHTGHWEQPSVFAEDSACLCVCIREKDAEYEPRLSTSFHCYFSAAYALATPPTASPGAVIALKCVVLHVTRVHSVLSLRHDREASQTYGTARERWPGALDALLCSLQISLACTSQQLLNFTMMSLITLRDNTFHSVRSSTIFCFERSCI